MKKILAVLAVLATVLSLSACKMSGNMTAEEREQYLAEKQSEQIEASLQAERDYVEGINETADKIGKTKKGERLVVKIPSQLGTEYWVFEFDKKEVVEYKMIYRFFELPQNYESAKNFKGTKNKKVVDTDDKSRMVVYKHTGINENTFDELYDSFLLDVERESGYEIIE